MPLGVRLNNNFMLVRFFIIVVLTSVPSFVFAQTQTGEKLPQAVEDCQAKLAIEYNKGEMKYKDWLIKFRQCYVDNGASNLIPESLNVYATSSNTFDNNFATADCIVDVQRWYNEKISQCLDEKAAPLKQFQDSKSLNPNDYQKIQKITQKVQVDQQTCYQGSLLEEFKQKNATCYKNSSFGDIWDSPVMKQALADQFLDWQNVSPEKGKALNECLQTVNKKYNVWEVSAETQRAVSGCLSVAGLKGIADVQAKAAVAIDCATAKWPIKTAADVRRVAANQSADDHAYLEKCVMTKLAPAAIGTAVASVPLAAGWRSVFLFGQLVVTQPLVLLRRKKYKTWGTVFDSSTTEPIDLGSVRLLESKANKVIGTAVTNKQGQYLFLPPPGDYKVLVDKPGYIFPSALLSLGVYERDDYFGESIVVRNANEVVDRHIPIDPHSKPISVWKFYIRQWRYRFAVLFGFVSPLISVIGFIILRTWWLGIFVAAHILVFGIFFRLSLRQRARKFGVVRNKNKQPISGVTVSLFRVDDKKLLNYYVTDLFGRYFFPRIVGDYTIVYAKLGYGKKEIRYSIGHEDAEKSTVMFDAVLE